ncbi:type II CAAX endopeptidase family protein [uncultured Clostridium sp.]|uniref:CPBP family intramembrane glutamic endopeptidase n=1 Tax=uncultured Clostridium sp. TaxID=59620 RepID=UPI00260A06EE|nr:type II CAAX endopeptidase family protein [uncultured Clostridium sp.]
MEKIFNLNSKIFQDIKGLKLSSVVFTILSPIIIMILGAIPINIIASLIFSFIKDIKIIETYLHQIILILSTGMSIIICFLIVKFKEKRKIGTMGFSFNKKSFIDYLEGFGLGIAMIGIVWVGIALFGNATFEVKLDSIMRGSFLIPFILMTVAWIIQGASEEIMLRGYMLPVLGVKVGPKFGIIVSSLFFSALHLANSGVTVLSLINLALFGFFAAFYAMKSESLWGICALHSAWNFAQQNIFGTLVSGGIVYNSSIINTTYIENNLINGGNFGPEGGILVTAVLVIGITIQVIGFKKRNI